MFKKILIANRGEIVIRVIRACKELGIKSVAVYSEADRNSLHVILASEAYYIGPADSRLSYLNIDRIIQTALKAKVDAIHPGYGFLSESSEFAKACQKAGIHYIGPSAEIIEAMGDKLHSRRQVEKVGVPVVPGVSRAIKDLKDAKEIANKITYPVMLKACGGGGGRGIRAVYKPADLGRALKACQAESYNFFGTSDVFMEKLITNPKHIEVQILADQHGNIVHLFERECSMQRRHQKLIEESPSPNLPPSMQAKMANAALTIAKEIKYTNAGTVEFVYDVKQKSFYFLEMNTRLQVEHPVTELVTGVDIVKEQIAITAGQVLKFSQKDIEQKGHAIELRICAEDPRSFLPSPGWIRRCRIPQGPFVRVDAYCYTGYKVPIYYDPMIAKLISWGKDREDCINKLQRALSEFSLTGIKTNILLHRNILMHEEFLSGKYTTRFIENFISQKNSKQLMHFVEDNVFLIAAAILAYKKNKKASVNVKENKWKQKARLES